MIYEEMYLRWMKEGKGERKELTLKKMIQRLLRNIQRNDLHKKIVDLPADDLLTTNYDYNLEATLPNGLQDAPPIYPVGGSKYAMLRRRQIGEDKILWHLHGEAAKPGSILLGYEPYSGYLARIKHYMTNEIVYKHQGVTTEIPALLPRLRVGKKDIRTWVDHFFLSDIYIIGMSLDFVEMHLWWLLHYRARRKVNSEINIDNHIHFLYPSSDQSWIKSRIALLCACQVECIPVPVQRQNWKRTYESAINLIRSGIQEAKSTG